MILSFHHVSPDGAISLVAANVPYSNLQWERSFSAPGSFSALLACPLPVEWPGRYIVALDGREEVGIIEKVEITEGAGASMPTVSGRFAESLFARYRFGPEGESATGTNWRQAVTDAIGRWRLSDAPALAMDAGTEKRTGSSHAIVGEPGKDAAAAIYAACSSHGAYPLLTYKRDDDPDRMKARIVDGLDRTRSQSERPLALLSLTMGDVQKIEYSGDYSPACSVVKAYAARDGEGSGAVMANVPVPGFDRNAQWAQVAVEDVVSLAESGSDPTSEAVAEAGRLRALDHMPALSVDCAAPAGCGELFDLGDTVEVEIASIGLSASMRVEAVRETFKADGRSVEATLGTKRLSRLARAMIGRR